MNTYTLFHTAEDAAGCPYLYKQEPHVLSALDVDGGTREVVTWKQDMGVKRRFQDMRGVLEAEGLLRRARLGAAELLYVPDSKDVHQFVVSKMSGDPLYLVAGDDRDKVRARLRSWKVLIGPARNPQGDCSLWQEPLE